MLSPDHRIVSQTSQEFQAHADSHAISGLFSLLLPRRVPPDPLARWLVQQNGGKDAIRLSLAEAIHAATGKNVVPIDPANPADAAVIAKLGSVLDRVLPGMNKPESSAHVVSRMDEVTAFF